MNSERYSKESWQKRYKPIRDWDAMFQANQWDYLSNVDELPRYAIIAGLINKLTAPGATVLDVGCGEGVLVDYLNLGRTTYSGIDLSPTAVARARKRATDSHFEISDIADYVLCDSIKPTTIVFNEVLPHVGAPIEALNRFLSFLSADGFVIVSLYQSEEKQSNARLFTDVLESEIAAGRYALLTRVHVFNSIGQAWMIYCLRAPSSAKAEA